MSIAAYEQAITRAQVAHAAALATLATSRASFAQASDDAQDAATSLRLLQEVAATIQQQAHASIAALVGRCLSAVFAEPYEFVIEFEQKRGRTEARLAFKRRGYEVAADDIGGGVIDVTSFALRLASLLLSRPPKRRLLVMDEPFKHLSMEYRPNVRSLLEALADELQMQFILVTHDPALQIGNVVEL